MSRGAVRAPLPAEVVLGVDGGNSKTELVLATTTGQRLAMVRGPTVSHQAVGLEAGIARLGGMVREAAGRAGLEQDGPVARIGVFCLAGADFSSDVRRLAAAIAAERLTSEFTVRNDTFAALRAGAPRGWGVVLVCGAGVNCAGIGPDGRTVGMPALGDISGDWGGGQGIGLEALRAAIRARDGRGPRTILERLVPEHFGLRRPISLTRAIYEGRIEAHRLRELAPVVFAAAGDDAVARAIVDRLADELATMAVAIIRRLRLTRRQVDVVLAGRVFATEDAAFRARLVAGVREQVPGAELRRLSEPPVLGAALLALDRAAAGPEAEARLRGRLAGAGQGGVG